MEVMLADPDAVEPGLLGMDDLLDRLPQRLAVVEPCSGVPLAGEHPESYLDRHDLLLVCRRLRRARCHRSAAFRDGSAAAERTLARSPPPSRWWTAGYLTDR